MKNNVHFLPTAGRLQAPKTDPVTITIIMPKKTATGHIWDLAMLLITGAVMGAVFAIGAFL